MSFFVLLKQVVPWGMLLILQEWPGLQYTSNPLEEENVMRFYQTLEQKNYLSYFSGYKCRLAPKMDLRNFLSDCLMLVTSSGHANRWIEPINSYLRWKVYPIKNSWTEPLHPCQTLFLLAWRIESLLQDFFYRGTKAMPPATDTPPGPLGAKTLDQKFPITQSSSAVFWRGARTLKWIR